MLIDCMVFEAMTWDDETEGLLFVSPIVPSECMKECFYIVDEFNGNANLQFKYLGNMLVDDNILNFSTTNHIECLSLDNDYPVENWYTTDIRYYSQEKWNN